MSINPGEQPRVKPTGAAQPLWDRFQDWADINAIGLADSDWLPWWHCYLAGSQTAIYLAMTRGGNDG